MKIYTKKGDTGTTQLIGGKRVPKHHHRIEAYGTIDELNSFIGLVRDQQISQHHQDVLIEIQDRLFTIGASLATDPDHASESTRQRNPILKEEDIVFLEKEMDVMEEKLPEMKSFVLPGGHQAVSVCHVARCVCRRAERLVTALSENDYVEPLVVKYLNRLSDYLFVLSRMLTLELQGKETPWKPRMG